jgi:hypothetical protein
MIATKAYLYFPVSESIKKFRLLVNAQNINRNIVLGPLLDWWPWAAPLALTWHWEGGYQSNFFYKNFEPSLYSKDIRKLFIDKLKCHWWGKEHLNMTHCEG